MVRMLGENSFRSTLAINTLTVVFLPAANVTGVVVQTAAWARNAGSAEEFKIRATDGVRDFNIVCGLAVAGNLEAPVILPPGWGLDVYSGDSSVDVAVTWDDLP